ncbi:prolipoprotein diacylglyceryl transferase [Actinocrinis puniceicyclus]|uniref:Phosphatidylglycerol--prolipoprotein diacylglyceryl transferase n=1 Tax=Actinocrinis puniceicyclus TaxID=977794 RepID=A0A8J7WNI1_9ACTN|nr:prolipoprotein diacylglyceryl transferase [Actinocrinis puniceicyclus]MBS2962700.1 prolipoprotein diacylglyceryl transferase [Actinocrinis puniceicyclus]
MSPLAPHPLAFLPSPTSAELKLGPFPIRFYALCIIAGIAVAVWLGERRWRARGGEPNVITDIAIWAVPFGLLGGRLYHVITDYELYFTAGKDWVRAFYIWDGGLGIWGAIALGAVGAWIGARRRGVKLPPLADAIGPGIVLAQGIGRWGNWFNNELYGDPTTKPWGLTIHCMDDTTRQATPCSGIPGTTTIAGHFQPTFLYESIWCVIVALIVLWADRRFRMGHGRVFALYVLLYTIGRGWVEHLRSDYAHHILGLRLNDWTSILVGLGALLYLIASSRMRPGRETQAELYWPDSATAQALAARRESASAPDADEDDGAANTGAPAPEDPAEPAADPGKIPSGDEIADNQPAGS